ncbi:hypothetical protein Q5424_00300 [Conexibacter sp. JD483]|uniref:YfhO family protein n=1 Tax=unclassified Conexibacter TaxID=2627773 RepID=UPI00272562E1|nr:MULTISPECIES: hypothetical protein [unclassified Conexibacter]MDO8184195.1 hypothetical protein [Conexibacter sp. CPCC 205706]MDO8197187.1 hypothetical protein [Conexibacter sp. CPCC 205762]MDR9367498.1 hypothetical protein [Conexibacter sp. JD483]
MTTIQGPATAHANPPRRTRARIVADAPVIRYFVAHPDLSAALLIALLVIVYLWPVLIGEKILSPIGLMYGFTPWQSYAPSDLGNYYNPLLSDIPMAVYPWRWYARQALHDGTLPLWNTQIFGGIPFFSNPQNGLFTPFNWLLWTLPLNYALGLSAALKLWAGGFGTYLLARQLRLGFLPGLLGGVAFAFCAFNITWLTHETLPAVAVLLPWMLWLIERIYASGRLSTTLWLAVATAVGLGGGHPGMQVHLMAIAGLYAIVRIWLVPDLERGTRLRRLVFVGGGLLLGAMLMAVMLIPETLSSNGTIGTKARAGGNGTLPGTVMPFDAIKTTVFPDWWGRPSRVELGGSATSAGGVVNYNERTFYGGVVALLFALVALVSRRNWRAKGAFVLLAFIGLAVPLHLPVLWDFVTNVPPFDLVQNQRMHFVYAFAVAILAAFGLHELTARPADERWRLAVPGVALLFGFIAMFTIGANGSEFRDLWKHFATGTDFAVREVLALTSVTWFLLLSLGVGIALLLAIRRPRWRYGIAVAVVLLAAIDALHFANGYQPMASADKAIPPTTPAIDYLKRHAREGRIVGLGGALPQDWTMTYGLSDVRGYDPPNPTQRFYDLWLIANPGQIDWTPFGVGNLEPEGLQVLSMLGTRYLIADPGLRLDRSVRRDPVLGALSVVYAGSDATILSNVGAVPRARVASRVDIAEDQETVRNLIARPDFSPTATALIERGKDDATALAGKPPVHGTVAITDERNSSVALDVRLDRRGLVVLNDNLTEGWTVKVDGVSAEPIQVDNLMRGVVVEEGHHKIVWSYAMPGLKTSAVITLISLCLITGGFAATMGRQRRATSSLHDRFAGGEAASREE